MIRAVCPFMLLGSAAVVFAMMGCEQPKTISAPTSDSATPNYIFERGYSTPETIQKAYDDTDLNTAIQAYKFFYPSVSMSAIWQGNARGGLIANKSFMLMNGSPYQAVFTPNSDTPYSGANIDLSDGPMVVEIPPGAIMGVVNDMNQRYVMDLGIPGPDAGKGGRHLILPPGYKGKVPSGYFTATPTTNHVLLMVRSIPPEGNVQAAIDKLKAVKLYPLNKPANWPELTWLEIGTKHEDFSPVPWEKSIQYWQELAKIVNDEPPFEAYRMEYGLLASLGIEKGKPFNPDARTKAILEKAAVIANDQMRIQAFADRRPDRIAWQDRKWEWVTLRPENGTFDTATYKDLEARTKWFYQAQLESPAMSRRTAAAGSLYWLSTRDSTGAFLDGGKTYKLTVPQPVPARLFWSVTIYDNETRSEIVTDTHKAALRSLYELKGKAGSGPIDLYFGPTAPAGHENEWIKTNPNKGWFTYFRIYGPDAAAFDGSWKPGDFEEVK